MSFHREPLGRPLISLPYASVHRRPQPKGPTDAAFVRLIRVGLFGILFFPFVAGMGLILFELMR